MDYFIKVDSKTVTTISRHRRKNVKRVVETVKKFCPKCCADREVKAWWYVKGRFMYALICKHRVSEKVPEVRGVINDPVYFKEASTT